ncbi:MAG TPA: hypothetical protein VEU33_07710 [Archangium sp.]|nr:hypothetical protein [Archangium sp.]
MSSQGLDEVIRHSVHFLWEHGQQVDSSVDRMLLDLRGEEQDEAQTNPCHLLGHAMGGSLKEVAQTYIRSTRYLFPLLHAYACALAAFSQHERESLPIYLFMRDALVFWPTLRTLPTISEKQIRFIFYSRRDARAGRLPVEFSYEPGQGLVEEPLHCIQRGLLADVGLYGSLLHTMFKSGTCARGISVLFLGSRNPFLAGWLNMVLSAALLRGDPSVDLHDTIRLVDTVESLLKPYRLSDEGALELTQPLSFICSMAFLWALHRYSMGLKAPPSLAHCARTFHRARKSPGYWLVDKAVPRWAEADRFIASWDLGPIAPMDMLSGFNL